jgi:GDP-4-dehydro-6-deoxy-D-mannose reductase
MNGSSRTLVTGAAGFAGSHLLDLLEQQGRPVVACFRRGEPLPPPPTGRTCRWVEIDVLARPALEALIAEVRPTVVYHLAGAAHVGRSWDRSAQTLAVNVLGTHHLLSAIAALGLRARVLVSGSALVYRMQDRAITEDDPVGPQSPYGLSKLAQEMTGTRGVTDLGLPVVVTRSFNHVGPRQDPSFFASSFARQIARIERGLGEPVLSVGNLDARRDLTDVRDTVRAYQALAERGQPGRLYNVCSGRAYRVGDILDALVARARRPITVHVDPARYRPNDTPLVLGSHARLTDELGWTPGIPMAQTLDDLLAYWRGATAGS